MCSFTVLWGSRGVWKPPGIWYHQISGITSIWCNHHLPHAVQHISLRIELIRLLIVACWMLVHSSSMVMWSCWILAGTGTHCCLRRSRASQTCSMGDMSGEYAGHARTGMFSASRNCVQILSTWGPALSCCNMRWWSWMNATTMGQQWTRILSRYLCEFKMPSIKCTYVHCP